MDSFALKPCVNTTVTMDAFENELSKLLGLDSFKLQLRALRRQGGSGKMPHFIFRGNPGTGKTTVGLMMGKLLHMIGIIPKDKAIQLQYRDFSIGPDGTLLARPETREKIKEAEGGVLFVNDAMPQFSAKDPICCSHYIEEDENLIDYVDAEEEILSFMDSGNGVVVFSGCKTQMCSDEAFNKRVSIVSHFDDLSCEQLAKILHLRMPYQRRVGFKIKPESSKSPTYVFDPWCQSVENVAALIEQETSVKQRMDDNGLLVGRVLERCIDSLCLRGHDLMMSRMPVDPHFFSTFIKQDLVYALRQLRGRVTDSI